VGKTDFDMPWGINNEVGANACRASDFRVVDSSLEEMHIIELIRQDNGVEVWTDTSKVPIVDAAGKVVGVLGVIEDITARKQIEQALEDANARLQALSRVDSLTQVANRRHFGERLDEEWARASREGHDFGIIIFDIDHFKSFNDEYGHLAGDDCLAQVAHAAKAALKRPGDFIARYGGEEFAVILPHVNAEGARVISEEIRRAVENMQIEHEGQQLSVTISAGVAVSLPEPSSQPTPLLAKADQALYLAKKAGRNRVVVASA
jgi:diguanylate cyclase (GGDEF)-like protein